MSDSWKKFTTAMKEKRVSKNKAGSGPAGNTKVLKKGEIIVQRLSSDVQGKAQKYGRIGPREFVPFPYDELTLENIKDACQNHFKSRIDKNTVCDILAGDQGPSCSLLEQIPNFNVIHVRFVECAYVTSSAQSKRPGETTSLPPLKRPRCSKGITVYPKSLSVADMLKLGTVIEEKYSTIELHEFDVHTMTWSSKPTSVKFCIEKDLLGQGGFREVYKATSSTPGFSDTVWVVKKYLLEALAIIKSTKQTIEEHTMKVVQMHMLAKNITDQLTKKLRKEGKLEQYGETLKYKKIYMGKPDYMVIEEFVEGEFIKFLNNTGSLCGEDSEIRQKAESLTHYSYEKSNHQLMIVDIQGCGPILYDPEIASKELMSQSGDHLMFAAGNLTFVAIDTFVKEHTCNKYCELLGLPKF